IVEWRVFRGRSGVFMTGFDRDGNVVKGISMKFAKGVANDTQLVAAVNDGHGFSGRHTYATAKTVAPSPSPASAAFTSGAVSDLVLLNALLPPRVDQSALCGHSLTSPLGWAHQCIGLGLPFCGAAPEGASLTAANCSTVRSIGIPPTIFAAPTNIRTNS